MGDKEVRQFISHLALNRQVSPTTQALALNALAYLYNKYLKQPLGDIGDFKKARRQQKLPVVLNQNEIKSLFAELQGKHKLLAGLLYGSGLRRIELVRLRVNDIDFDHLQIRVWNGKGFKHRLTTLAPELAASLRAQIESVRELYNADIRNHEYLSLIHI